MVYFFDSLSFCYMLYMLELVDHLACLYYIKVVFLGYEGVMDRNFRNYTVRRASSISHYKFPVFIDGCVTRGSCAP